MADGLFPFLDEDEEEQKQSKPVAEPQDTATFNFLDEAMEGVEPSIKKDVAVSQETPMFDDVDFPIPQVNTVPLASPDDDDEEIDIKVTPPPEAE